MRGLSQQQIQDYALRDFFIYELDFAAVAAGTSVSAFFAVQADSDFIWQKGTFFADVAGVVAAQPLLTIVITDSAAGRNLSNSAAPVFNQFGTGQLPFILPRPRIFRSQTTVTVQISNFSAATTYNLRLSFIGEKGFWQ